MTGLDIRTLLAVLIGVDVILSLVMVFYWRTQRVYAGFGLWTVCNATVAACYLLFLLRGTAPALVSIVVANTLVVLSGVLRFGGMRRFLGARHFDNVTLLLPAGAFFLLCYFTFVQDDPYARTAVGQAPVGLMAWAVALLVLGHAGGRDRPAYLWIGTLFAMYGTLFLARVFYWLLEPHGSPLLEPNAINTVTYLLLVFFDITVTFALLALNQQRTTRDLASAQAAAEAGRGRLAEIVASLPDATLAVDASRTVVAWNDAAHELTGIPAEKVLGRPYDELAAPALGERWPTMVDLAIDPTRAIPDDYPMGRREDGKVTAEFDDITIAGRTVSLWKSAVVVRDAHGNPGGVVESTRDVTERKAAEVRLRESEVRFRTLLESAHDAIFIWDGEGRCLEANRAACERLGYSHDELLSMTAADISAPDQASLVAERMDAIKSVGSAFVETVHVSRDGMLIPVEVSTAVTSLGGRTIFLSIARDITERKRAEAELRATHDRLQRFFDANIIGTLIIRESGPVLEANDHFLGLVGRTREELDRGELDWRALTPPEWLPVSDRAIGGIRSGGAPGPYEKEYLRPDGSRVPVLVAATALAEPEGLIAAFVLDNTERKRAEEALRVANQRLQRFVDSNVVGVTVSRADGRILEANDYYLHLIGSTRDKLERDEIDWRALTPPEWLPVDERGLAELRKRGICTPYEKEYVLADGSRIPVIVGYARLPESEEMAAFVLDISERKRAEEELRVANTRLRRFIDGSLVGIAISRPDGMVLDGNDSYLRLVGYTRAELEQGEIDWRTFTPPEWRAADERGTAEMLERGVCTPYEKEYLVRGGRRIPVLIAYTLLPGPGEETASFIVDVSELKAAQLELRTLNADLEERVSSRTAALEAANLELEAFSYSVSHDLRAPLRAISSFSEILVREHNQALDDEARRLLGVVTRNADRMGRLIDDLLWLSRIGRQKLGPGPVDMEALARSVAGELQTAHAQRTVEFDIGPLGSVTGDSGLLRQIWVNLIGNAVKFTAPVPRPRIEVRCERADGEIRYTVRDNGVGFDAQYVDKLFQPFQRLHTTAEFEGTGIGLAIVARIAHRHGGRVWAEGAAGEGATFGFSLPAGELR